MSSNLGQEGKTVQEPLVKYAIESGWNYVSQSDAVSYRQGESGLLFYRILAEKLIQLNPGLITTENVNEVIQRIESVSNTIEGNAEILAWLRGEKSIYDPNEKRQRNVVLIDFSDLSHNLFQVTDEWQYTNGKETNRADVMFLINGIPSAIIETKSAKKEKGIEEGLIQIREYHHETPEMLIMPQVFDITHLLDFYYGVTWNLERKGLFNWKNENPPESPFGKGGKQGGFTGDKDNFEKKVKQFFNLERFLKMLREWILFYVKDDELRKTILRQHQSRAVEKIIVRCADKVKKTGLIWHTQGAGKTFTMITAAKQILDRKEFFVGDLSGKPTVILMIDRNELEGQLSGWVERILGELRNIDIKPEYATSKARLQELLKSDFRGLIVSMIHKFEGIPKDINTRDSIYVFIDEAHRSVGGDLGNYLTGALPNATLIGFTGTPIDKTAYGKGTFKIFGKEDEQGYLDKYPIPESIDDGTTVPLKYALAPNEIRVPKEMLEEEFFELVESGGISDIDDLNEILDKAVKLKTFLKSDKRVKEVTQFVAKHFKENVEPLGYKAFLVGVDREACALYKESMDNLLPPEYSETIYSPAQHDSEKYPLVYKHQVAEAEEKKYKKIFLKPETLPKIFIVTDKLLTGYDAPILYCMYLDKPMRDHVLLQAIARVNRPYEQEKDIKKHCGLVVDFVGIFEKLEKALAFDSDVVNGVIENIELVLLRFKGLITNEAKQYLDLCKPPIDDKAVERAVDAFSDKSDREKFYKFYKEVESLYEILSPSPELRDFINDVRNLATLYQIIRNAYRGKTFLYGDVAKKTEMLVREQTASYGLTGMTDIVKIDENTLKTIKDKYSSDNTKVINLINSINKTVLEDGAGSPYLKSIGDRAEAIRESYDDRQVNTRDALRELESLAVEINEARKKQNEMKFDINTFTLFWTLKQEKIKEPEINAEAINSVFLRFPNFNHNAEELRQLKAELYKLLLPVTGKDGMIALVEKLLKINRK